MQIQLRQSDIEAAIRQYLGGKNIATAGESISIVFTAGRKAGGLTAAVTIGEEAPAAVQVAAATQAPVDQKPVAAAATPATAAAPVQVPAVTTLEAQGNPMATDASVTTLAVEQPAAAVEAVNTPAAEAAPAATTEVKPTTSLFS